MKNITYKVKSNGILLMKKIFVIFILVFIVLLSNSCTAGFLGVPDTFKGYYQSEKPILDEETYLFIYVATGSFTIYLSKDGDTNINNANKKEYASISPYNIIGFDYNYTFETGNMNGTVNFNGREGADVVIQEYGSQSTIRTYCRKVS